MTFGVSQDLSMSIALLVTLLVGFSAFATAAHLVSIAVVARSMRSTRLSGHRHLPAVTIVRPISELYSALQETLESTFRLTHPRFEIILCAARESDQAVAVARALMAKYPRVQARLLIGDVPFSQNPKLNNCAKGWEEARHDLIALIDCNVLLPADYLEQMLSNWGPEVGLVSSPPVGAAPDNFWAEVECSFLNTYQGRWQLFAQALGIAYAHGKNLMVRKSMLAKHGGIRALADEPAEDAAATKLMRRAGLRIALNNRPFCQPLGTRSAAQVWKRQVRWAKLRRATFPTAFLAEILSGSALPLLAGGLAAALMQWQAALLIASHALLWFGAEMLLAYRAGWPLSTATFAGMLIRDALIPPIWLAALLSSKFEWGGHQMQTSVRLSEAD
jgi:ceramide glucosyltransferase